MFSNKKTVVRKIKIVKFGLVHRKNRLLNDYLAEQK